MEGWFEKAGPTGYFLLSPSKEEKSRRREIAKTQKLAATQAALARLPIAIDQMQALFDYVDGRLTQDCDHSLTYTIEFLSKENLPQRPVLAWMEEHGGYCDCEVIGNAEEAFQSLVQSLKYKNE